ncbi:MAG: altronate oxidoreductase, partial [Chitinophagaceae bacterium]
ANPFIRHNWIAITMNYSSKLKMRCVPLLVEHYRKHGSVPELMALGFAAYIRFMKATELKEGAHYGEWNGKSYLIQDEQAATFFRRWTGLSPAALVRETLRDGYWGASLHNLPGFAEAVTEKLIQICNGGAREALETQTTKKANVA